MRRLPALTVLLTCLLGAAACAAQETASTAQPGVPATGAGSASAPVATGGAPGTTLAVVREVLAHMADPPGAPGRTLSLVRYTIAPGAKLSPHIHPGVQMASIQSGTLTYTIESGTAIVTRAGATEPERLVGPLTTELRAGDAVQEISEMVHFGANDTDEAVLIDAALLTETGVDLAVTMATVPPG